MNFRIIRNDGLEDHLTSYEFENYAEAFDLIEKEIGSLCCADTDFNEEISYEIIKI
tara:strand:- start:48 stop:215 length:168 start_codon:yes stop_codon:yes gene_type:complete